MSALTGLLVLVVAEVLALVAVAERIGPLDAILFLVILSACGPALVRRSGIGGMRRIVVALRRDQDVDRVGADVLLRLVGGLLVCIPGYLTGIAGLALWVPPVRAVVRRRLARRRAALLVDAFGQPAGPPPTGRRRRSGSVVDAGSHPVEDDPVEHPELDG
jgi:UPF0716 protein FxsA